MSLLFKVCLSVVLHARNTGSVCVRRSHGDRVHGLTAISGITTAVEVLGMCFDTQSSQLISRCLYLDHLDSMYSEV